MGAQFELQERAQANDTLVVWASGDEARVRVGRGPGARGVLAGDAQIARTRARDMPEPSPRLHDKAMRGGERRYPRQRGAVDQYVDVLRRPQVAMVHDGDAPHELERAADLLEERPRRGQRDIHGA